jgi:rRNA maturation endonuclease Nob1
VCGAAVCLVQNFWTIEEVVAEVRDPHARERLKALPFELKFKRPSDDALTQGLLPGSLLLCVSRCMLVVCWVTVAEFAKKTGDFRELSRTDLMVLALAYMMEVECNGTKFLNPEPVGIPLDMLDVIDDPSDDEKASPEVPSTAADTELGLAVAVEDTDEGWTEVRTRKPDTHVGVSKTQKRRQQRKAAKAAAASATEAAPEGVLETPRGERDDGEGEWFGPDTSMPTQWATELPEGRVAVGCVTTDFAMQVRDSCD